MSFLVRKINRNNWDANITDISHIGADAITNCMRTKKNCMSVYEIPSEAKINDALLAIASNFDNPDTFDVVLMKKGDIKKLNIELIQNPGATPIEHLQNAHFDITGLSYRKLGTIANYIVDCIRKKRIVRCTRGELKEIFLNAKSEGLVDPKLLKKNFRIQIYGIFTS